MQYVFGTGLLFAQPEGADTGANTPVQVGAFRGVSVDMGFSAKDLHGDGRPWPLAVGRGTGKVACKAEYAQLTAEGFNLLFFGGPAPAVGSTCIAVDEVHTVTGNAVTPLHAATFGQDLGIVAALPEGDMFYRVASAPGPRQYTCNETTGAYGFGGSNGQVVWLSYSYADASNGRLISLPNRNIGHTPRFSAVLTETFNGKAMTLTLNSCSASRLGFTSKMEDFTIPQFSFSAAADDSGLVGTLSVVEGADNSNNSGPTVPCEDEDFSNGLVPYSLITGNASLFTIVSTPYGNGIAIASETSGTQARIRRSMVSRTETFSFSAKFQLRSFAADDAGVVTLTLGAAQKMEFNPRVQAATDASRRAQLAFGASAYLVTPSALAIDTWYSIGVTMATGTNNTVCTITRMSDNVVIQVTPLTADPPPMDGLEFHTDSTQTNSADEFAEIHVC